MARFNYSLLIGICISLSGCAYRLGNYTPNGIKTLKIGKVSVAGHIDDPRMALQAAGKIRTAFITDGSVEIVDNQAADAELIVKVANYKVTSAGLAKLASTDKSQAKYYTTIWRVTVTIDYQVLLPGQDASKKGQRQIEGEAIFNDLLDITTVREAAIHQALAHASKKLVRDAMDTDWKTRPVK